MRKWRQLVIKLPCVANRWLTLHTFHRCLLQIMIPHVKWALQYLYPRVSSQMCWFHLYWPPLLKLLWLQVCPAHRSAPQFRSYFCNQYPLRWKLTSHQHLYSRWHCLCQHHLPQPGVSLERQSRESDILNSNKIWHLLCIFKMVIHPLHVRQHHSPSTVWNQSLPQRQTHKK